MVMNGKQREHVALRLRELADKVESGETDIIEMSFFDHYVPCLVTESGMYLHDKTGDLAVQIRFKGKGLGPICVTDIK